MNEIVRYQPIPDGPDLGPAMRILNPKQRAFVTAIISTGGRDAAAAARASGYSPDNPNAAKVTAHRLMHDERILAAIRECADRKVKGVAVRAIETMIEIMDDPTHKDRFAAAKEVANRAGLLVVEKVEHVHRTEDEEEKVARIVRYAQQLGLDPRELLGSAGVVVDAEFKVIAQERLPAPVEDGTSEGLEDLL